jgi:hypothetical protein
MRTMNRSHGARAGRRRLARTIVAGGSAMVLGGVGLAAGATAPAAASHGGTANTGILNTSDWRLCAPGFSPPSRPAVGVNWGTAVWNAHPELTVTQVCADFNVFVQSASYPDSWLGLTTCPGGLDASRNCAEKFVALNARTIDATAEPVTQWKMAACHEFGHVGGLGHRTTNDSCMVSNFAPPASTLPDQHDNDAIAATYPR